MTPLLFLGLPILADIILLVAFVLLFVSVEKELPLGATLTILICAGLMHYLKVIDLSVAPNHLQDIGKWVGIWVVCGIFWAVVKWKLFADAWARSKREHISIVKAYFLDIKDVKGKSVPENLKGEWDKWLKAAIKDVYSIRMPSYVRDRDRDSEDKVNMAQSIPGEVQDSLFALRGIHKNDQEELSVRKNKGRITLWAIYWPWSFVWTVINDPLKRFYQHVLFVWIGGALQWIANSAKSSVDKDLAS